MSVHVLVLAGGLSPERDVSLRSGRRAAEALRRARPDWEVSEADVDAALLDLVAAHRPDCVVSMLHGAAGEDGSLRDLLESLNIPYLGSDARSSRIAFDKPVACTIVERLGIDVPAFMVLPQSTFRELGAASVMAAVVSRVGLPLIVKPTSGGSALGISVVRDAADLPSALVGAFSYADTAMIQTYVSGTEVAACVLGSEVLPVIEICPPADIYDYNARYTAGTTEFFCPARLTDEEIQSVISTALTVHEGLGLTDWSRSDLIVDGAGTVWFLEVNVAPGMTETSLMPQAIVAASQEVGDVIAKLVESRNQVI
jgi:D-alanine-D-alanine ligase